MKVRGIERIGYPGVAGVGLLLFGLSFLFGSVLPLHAELAELLRRQERLAADAAAQAGTPAAERHGRLPPFAEAPDLLKQLSAAAERNGVAAASAAYQLKPRGGQLQLEVTLPLKTGYPALRAYLRDALALSAPAALLDLSLQRTQASDPAVEAQVRLAYRFAEAP